MGRSGLCVDGGRRERNRDGSCRDFPTILAPGSLNIFDLRFACLTRVHQAIPTATLAARRRPVE